MLVLAHRGYSEKYPENTMTAFRKAIEVGADGIELDVHLSKDGEVMIIHDELLKRTTGEEGCVSDYTRSELERMKANKTIGFGDDGIPSLEEYLSFISKTDRITNIELKTYPICYRAIEGKVLSLLDRYDYVDRAIISSFNPFSIMEMKRLRPDIECGFLFTPPTNKRESMLKGIGFQLRELSFEAYHPNFAFLEKSDVEECHSNSIKVNAWTLNTLEEFKRAKELSIDAAITNNPELGLKILSD